MLFAPAAVYRSRNPQSSDYYRCVEDHFETFVQVYGERFERPCGFWRPYLQKVIDRYLGCGDLHHGFARVKCRDCHHEYLLAFVLKRSGNPALAGQAPSPPFSRGQASVPPAIRSGWWNSGNGSAATCSRRFPTGMSSSASRRSCAGTSSEPVLDLIGEPGSSFRSESLRLGIPEALSSGGGAGEESHPRRRHRHPDLWRLPRLQSPLPRPMPRLP